MTNNNKKVLYWVETNKKGDIFQESFSFDYEEAKAATITELERYPESGSYLAFCDYEGTETDPKAAFYQLTEEGFPDYDIERPNWFAVMDGPEDTDWGYGFFSLAEAEAEAVRMGGEAYVAEINGTGGNAVCVAEYYPNEQ